MITDSGTTFLHCGNRQGYETYNCGVGGSSLPSISIIPLRERVNRHPDLKKR